MIPVEEDDPNISRMLTEELDSSSWILEDRWLTELEEDDSSSNSSTTTNDTVPLSSLSESNEATLSYQPVSKVFEISWLKGWLFLMMSLLFLFFLFVQTTAAAKFHHAARFGNSNRIGWLASTERTNQMNYTRGVSIA